MTPAIQKQLVKGATLFAFGALYAFYAATQLPVGTPANTGAGLFPLIIGSVVALFGLGFAVPALIAARSRRVENEPSDRWEKIDWRGALAVSVAIAAFAALVGRFGLIPATLAMTAISAFGNRKITPLMVVVLSAGFLVTTYVIFVLGLNLPLDFWKWPF
jgi:hypothetical protein